MSPDRPTDEEVAQLIDALRRQALRAVGAANWRTQLRALRRYLELLRQLELLLEVRGERR